jgi:hypothetical protein
MTMKRIAGLLVFASVLPMLSSVLSAQQPSGGRRTDLEYLERGFDLHGITTSNQSPEFWNTPEGKAQYERLQLERFQKNTQELSQLGTKDWATPYDSLSNRRVRQEFVKRAQDLERVSGELIQFFEWRFQAPPLEIEEDSGESVRERVTKITPMAQRILETISALKDGGIPAKEFVEMRHNLVRIHTLSRRLRD